MKKYFFAVVLSLMLLSLLAVGFSSRVAAFDPFGGSKDPTICNQTDASGNQSPVCVADGTNPFIKPNGIISKIADIIAFLTGLAAVIFIIVGGFQYIQSSGDSGKVNSAKNTILYAVIGLVVVVVARSVVGFIVGKL
jgi:hypothetical protein